MLKDGNFLSNSQHRLSETGNAKLSVLFLNENSQETLFYKTTAVAQGNAKADTPADCLFRASLRNAASSSGLNTNVRKMTWSHNPQPVSRSTSHYKTSLEPKSPQHFEILPAMGEGRGSEEESGRKKETAAFPSQYFLWKLCSPLYTQSKKQELLFFLCPGKKMDKKALPSFTLANIPLHPCQVCWGAGAPKQQLSLGKYCAEMTFSLSISYF